MLVIINILFGVTALVLLAMSLNTKLPNYPLYSIIAMIIFFSLAINSNELTSVDCKNQITFMNQTTIGSYTETNVTNDIVCTTYNVSDTSLVYIYYGLGGIGFIWMIIGFYLGNKKKFSGQIFD